MIVCVDFDGTIVDHAFPEIGNPVPLAEYYLNKFQENDIKIILWTMRHGSKLHEATTYLNSIGIIPFGVNNNPDQKSWTDSPKAYGKIYIDDSAIGCPLITEKGYNRPYVNWSIVGPEVLKKLVHKKSYEL